MSLNYDERERLQKLEEEQDQLNSSLIALTTHFAQVQFRLKQIVDATPQEKETLLKDLEEFAFSGIPDIRDYKTGVQLTQAVTEQEHEQKLAQQRIKQKELICKLKNQLEDLEQYAYETGEAGMPQSMILERQSVIIEQLRGKLPIDFEIGDQMSPEELRMQVDKAIRQLVNPVKMKEQLVAQLKTQISDLERFIEFLQGKTNDEGQHCTCNCPVHNKSLSILDHSDYSGEHFASDHHRNQLHESLENKRFNGTVTKIVRRALMLLQMFAITQFGCGSRAFERNMLKKTTKGSHWGDLRAQLEIIINQVIELVENQEPPFEDSDYTSDSED
ncbi:RUN domain-containing protein 1-like, partial [Centruroides sculpturatus]|uniref:RUN domain-containing protein 1-like n=1 Tax=Centruroides sculpturatus TaxID=218467 RepID=UPI000C6D68E0